MRRALICIFRGQKSARNVTKKNTRSGNGRFTEPGSGRFTDARMSSAKDILAAEGGEKNIRKNDTCLLCHFTPSQASFDAPTNINAGPSCRDLPMAPPRSGCRSIRITVARTSRKSRKPRNISRSVFLASSDAGMIWPSQLFDIAENCMFCHGMTNEEYDARTLKNMIEAGHPVRGNFELVLYSQGSVRHRFYDPADPKNNLEMTPAQLARMFVTGHAVGFVKAHSAKDRIPTKKYVEAQQERIAAATRMLEAIKGKGAAGRRAAGQSTGRYCQKAGRQHQGHGSACGSQRSAA